MLHSLACPSLFLWLYSVIQYMSKEGWTCGNRREVTKNQCSLSIYEGPSIVLYPFLVHCLIKFSPNLM